MILTGYTQIKQEKIDSKQSIKQQNKCRIQYSIMIYLHSYAEKRNISRTKGRKEEKRKCCKTVTI